MIDGPIAKKIEAQLDRIQMVSLNKTINDPYSLEKVIKATEDEKIEFSKVQKNRDKAVELILQHISKSKKILYGNEKMSVNWVEDVLEGSKVSN
jgi:hypothetical protein